MPGQAILFKNILLFFKSYYITVEAVSKLVIKQIDSTVGENRVRGTYHVDAAVTGVKGQKVVSDEVGLFVEPLSLENEPVF